MWTGLMIAIVLVSHSAKIAEGVKDLADQISQGRVPIFAVGGVDSVTIGTNVNRIVEALGEAVKSDGVLVLYDLGSAIMSAEMAIEQLPAEARGRVRLGGAPLVEGAVIAAIEASLGSPLDAVQAAAEGSIAIKKLAP
jgi:phosphocarrier protein FPr